MPQHRFPSTTGLAGPVAGAGRKASRFPKPLALGWSTSLAALLVALLLGGCSSNPTSPDAGAAAQTSCSSDAECTKGFTCDQLRRVCVCTSDAICQKAFPSTPYCNAITGQCVADVAGCKSDAACGAQKYCDIALRTCQPIVPTCLSCTEDAQCGAGSSCAHSPAHPDLGTYCFPACGSDGSCALSGYQCVQTEKGKQCLPATGVCGASNVCVPDTDQACTKNADCTEGTSQVCDQSLDLCVASEPTCKSNQVCDPKSDACIAACPDDSYCQQKFSDPTYKCVRGSCVQANPCKQDSDCPSSDWCQKAPGATSSDSGNCVASCATDSDCPLGDLCGADPGAPGHTVCAPGCHGDSGCPLYQICSNGQCVSTVGGAQACQVKYVCPFDDICSNQSCVPSNPRECRSCSGGCGQGGCAQLVATSCDSSMLASCPAGATHGSTSDAYYQLDCPPTHVAYYCFISRCLDRCTSDDQCPNGFWCEQASVGGDQGPWCFPEAASYCL